VGAACALPIDRPPAGAVEVVDGELLAQALGAEGKGGLCAGKVYEVRESIAVYRVWASDKAFTETGRWWSFARPTGTRGVYREKNAVCPEWSPLDALSVCRLKVGARFVVGPGQSATCEKMGYSASATNQVYVPNDGRNNRLWVGQCERLEALP